MKQRVLRFLLILSFLFLLNAATYLFASGHVKSNTIPAKRPSLKGNLDSVILNQLKEGDIVFQITESGQGKAIQLATHSKYTHCGILFKVNGKWMVYEALQPVMRTSLKEWISRGKNQHWVVKRLINNQPLTNQKLTDMKNNADAFLGKNYDLYFGWSDDKIYCSELVWKIYQRNTSIELTKLKHLKEYDLNNILVKATLKERYGDNIPLEELVVSPSDIFDSPLLKTILNK